MIITVDRPLALHQPTEYISSLTGLSGRMLVIDLFLMTEEAAFSSGYKLLLG